MARGIRFATTTFPHVGFFAVARTFTPTDGDGSQAAAGVRLCRALRADLHREFRGSPCRGRRCLSRPSWRAAHGQMRIVPVIACAWAASVLGGFVGFAVGRFGGHKLLQKYGGYIWIDSERLKKIETFYTNYGAAFVVLGRLRGGAADLRHFGRLHGGVVAEIHPLQCRGGDVVGWFLGRCSCCGSAATCGTSGTPSRSTKSSSSWASR